MEQWRQIKEFPSYSVSDHGRVMRTVESSRGNLPKILRPWVTNKGYSIVTLFGDNGPKRVQVSRTVCKAFHGDPPSEEHQAAHNDGDPSNNMADNLRWATRKENMEDCLRHGTRAMGSRHGRTTKPERNPRGSWHGGSKLKEADVLAIRATPKDKGSGVLLSNTYGVSTATISMIRNGKNWKHI